MKTKNKTFHLKRLQITGVLCLIFGLIILAIDLVQKAKWYEYITVATLFVAGIIFIYVSNKMLIQEYLKNKTKK